MTFYIIFNGLLKETQLCHTFCFTLEIICQFQVPAITVLDQEFLEKTKRIRIGLRVHREQSFPRLTNFDMMEKSLNGNLKR